MVNPGSFLTIQLMQRGVVSGLEREYEGVRAGCTER